CPTPFPYTTLFRSSCPQALVGIDRVEVRGQTLCRQHVREAAELDGGSARLVPFDQLTLVLLAALRQLGHPFHLMLLDDDDAVGVADHRVSWAHELPADDQRLVDRAERLLDRPGDADARGEDGEPECPQVDGVA